MSMLRAVAGCRRASLTPVVTSFATSSSLPALGCLRSCLQPAPRPSASARQEHEHHQEQKLDNQTGLAVHRAPYASGEALLHPRWRDSGILGGRSLPFATWQHCLDTRSGCTPRWGQAQRIGPLHHGPLRVFSANIGDEGVATP